MSEQWNEAQEGAIRLFEAMSGVDEKYLAACENCKKAKPRGVVVFMQKYGKGMAAVLCLAVLGAGYVSMMRVANSDKVAMDCAPAASMPASQEQCEAEAPVRMEEAAEECMPDDDILTDNALSNGLSGSSALEHKEVGAQQDGARQEAETHKSSATVEDFGGGFTKDDFDAVDELTLEEARKLVVVGEYIPQNWPEDEGVTIVRASKNVVENGSKNVYLLWESNTTNEVYQVVIEKLSPESLESVQERLAKDIIQAENLSKDFIAANGDPVGEDLDVIDADFAVLHNTGSEYVLVHFTGNGSVERIWELFQ